MNRKSSFSNYQVYGLIGLLVVTSFSWLTLSYDLFVALRTYVVFFEVIALFNIMIIVHELGHFWAALWCKLKVEKFAIWFGPALWKKTINGVEYSLGTIPAGGYVALPQMANPESIEGKSDLTKEELPPAEPYKKMIVAFAGPLFSLLLAFAFACIVTVVGKPVSDSEKTTTIGYVDTDGPADKAGLKPGDQILSIDGKPVHRFIGMGDGINWLIMTSTNPTIDLEIKRDEQVQHLTVDPEVKAKDAPEPGWWERSAPRKILIAPANQTIKIKEIVKNSPADLAGLKPGDQVTEFNGQHLYTPYQLDQFLKLHPQDAIQLTVKKGETTQAYALVPVRPMEPKELPKEAPQTNLGINLWDVQGAVTLIYPSPWEQVLFGANAVWSTLVALTTPHSHVGISQLSGPVGIMNIFFAVLLSDYGWQLALWLAVIINVNLAIMNLFPFPILDGGHIVLSILEMIRRRPLSMSIIEPLQTACAVVLIGFMLFVTFHDVQDSYKMVNNLGNHEMKFAPPAKTP